MKTTRTGGQPAAPLVPERRNSPRMSPATTVLGVADTGETVSLMNVSEGGFMIHGPSFYTLGHVHEFEFRVGQDTTPVTVAGRVIHIVRVSAVDGQSYVTGLEFCAWKVDDQRRAVETLLATARTE